MVLAGSSVLFAAAGVTWLPLKDGMERAKVEKKPMIVDFHYGKGCPRCEYLDKNVYGDPAIAEKIMADFVPVRVDLNKKLSPEEQALGEKYNFKNDCLLLFLDPDGNLIKGTSGKGLCFIDKVDPEDFVKYLDSIKANSARQG